MPQTSPSVFFGMLNQDQKEEVLAEVAKEAAARFKVYREAVIEATALRDLRGEDKLAAYRQRTPEIWAGLLAKFPKEYQRQMGDFARLERDAYKRLERLIPDSPPDSTKSIIRGLPAVNKAAASVTRSNVPAPRY